MIKAEDLKVLNGYVLIEPLDSEENLIELPETMKNEQPKYGKVLAVADEYYSAQGNKIPIYVKPGDHVIFGAFAGDELKIEGKEYRVVEALYIRAIVKQS